jgi:hypothetical protein
VYEYVWTAVLSDETKTLLRVEPLYGSLCHVDAPDAIPAFEYFTNASGFNLGPTPTSPLYALMGENDRKCKTYFLCY